VMSPSKRQNSATGIAIEGAETFGQVVTYMIKKAGTYESESCESMDGISVPARRLGGIDQRIS